MLPKEYEYKFVNFKAEERMSDIMFEAEIRVNVSTKDGVKNFLRDFNSCHAWLQHSDRHVPGGHLHHH